jgi:hypothetical protein
VSGESGGIERFQLASEFCALQLPNAKLNMLIFIFFCRARKLIGAEFVEFVFYK